MRGCGILWVLTWMLPGASNVTSTFRNIRSLSLYDTSVRLFKIKEVTANTLWSIFNMPSHYVKSVPWFTISMFLTFPHKTKSLYQLSRRLLVLLVFRIYLCWKAKFWDILHVWSFSCYQIFNLKAVKGFRWVCSHSVS